jgi:hypothetical protein
MHACREPSLNYVKWYTGRGLSAEFICVACAEAREKGHAVAVEPVCKECFYHAVEDIGDLQRVGGEAEIKVSPRLLLGWWRHLV